MEQATGLREQKKLRTHQRLAATALRLFLERGFDAVSVADIAAAAEVSKPTLFRYFAGKEDLVLHRFADHQDEAARIVRTRAADQTPVQALHEHCLLGLRDRDPITGLNDDPDVVTFQQLLYTTPSLQTRLLHYTDREAELLAETLRQDADSSLIARLAALHLVTVRQELGRRNWRKIAEGRSADAVYPEAVVDANRAFGMLATGMDAFPRRSAH
ncbi:TetR family transcriptional regulator [Streptomyces sp. NBC_01794]|uniref:TetR family transcriptional regulator n=1 Tax=Streptomyces sp. NBC_01794 TaxID=2975942 RepID=UPI003085C61B|nr:TetR/AcrR family transcriptional regulator [Streptomyces sp. NBC_01794]